MDAGIRLAGRAIGGAGGSGAAETAGKPLTLDLMDRTHRQIDTANEICTRLYQLRDRLFGSPPTNAEGQLAGPPSEDSFNVAITSRTRHLSAILNDIDAISADIASRL